MKLYSQSKDSKASNLSFDQEINEMPGKLQLILPSTKLTSKSPKIEKSRERISSNLIDLESPAEMKTHEYMNEANHETDSFEDVLSSTVLSEFFLSFFILLLSL